MKVPFNPGRGDSSQKQTEIKNFKWLEPLHDGFRNYVKSDYSVMPEELVLDIVLGTTKGPILLGLFALVLSAAKITFSIEGPPEPIIIPVLILLISLSYPM